MRCDFKNSLHGSTAASQPVEKDPVEGDVITPQSTSPPRVLHSYQQHITNYVQLFMEEGKELTPEQGLSWPLNCGDFYFNTIVFFLFLCPFTVLSLSYVLLNLISIFRPYRRYA